MSAKQQILGVKVTKRLTQSSEVTAVIWEVPMTKELLTLLTDTQGASRVVVAALLQLIFCNHCDLIICHIFYARISHFGSVS